MDMSECATALFFGDPWDAPAVDWADRVDTPVGEHCLACAEPVVEGDRGWIRVMADFGPDDKPVGVRVAVHAECDMRSLQGHQVGACPCSGYGSDRAAARLVWERVGQQRGRPLEELSGLSYWRRDAGGWVHRGRAAAAPVGDTPTPGVD